MDGKKKNQAVRLTPLRRKMLVNACEGMSPLDITHVAGAHVNRNYFLLSDAGLLYNGKITDAGRAALAAHAP